MSAVCERCGSLLLDRLPACPRCLLTADIGGRVVGERYELTGEVGRGGMGTVYKALDLHDGSSVAVKVLREVLTERAGFLERFRQEARVLALMRHRGVVGFRSWGIEEGCAFIVMEYVDGRSLAGQLPVPQARALEIAREVCAAVACAHRHGLVHRDLKPENILVDRKGVTKVSDFGIAAFAADQEEAAPLRLTLGRQALGTPSYMAPEALRGAAPDPRMDVYSLGVLLYELVEGRPPQGYFELPAPFERVLKRALAADPVRRHADAGEMLSDLATAAPTLAAGAALPPREKVGALAASFVVAAGLALLLESVVARASALSSGLTPPLADVLTPALIAAVGLLSAVLLLRRWRELGLTASHLVEGIPQTPATLRFGLLTLALALWRVAPGFPGALAPWLAMALRGGQVCGLVAGVSGLIESRRCLGHSDEPLLWLGFFLLLAPFALELLPALQALSQVGLQRADSWR